MFDRLFNTIFDYIWENVMDFYLFFNSLIVILVWNGYILDDY